MKQNINTEITQAIIFSLNLEFRVISVSTRLKHSIFLAIGTQNKVALFSFRSFIATVAYVS